MRRRSVFIPGAMGADSQVLTATSSLSVFANGPAAGVIVNTNPVPAEEPSGPDTGGGQPAWDPDGDEELADNDPRRDRELIPA